MLKFAVFGHPVAHSLSPRIHAAFGRQCGIALGYTAIDAAPADFAAALAAFADAGGTGANITLPHKPAAVALCASLSERARRAGAVNTLLRMGDAWHGDNTDGAGLVRDLTRRHGVDLRGRRTLLLGAGGAAAGIVPALVDAGIGTLVVANRSPARAQALVAAAAPEAGRACTLEALSGLGAFELVVNATSATRGDGLPALPATLASASTVAVDLGYGAAAADFLAWAAACGVQARIDGLGMLVEQAAESFALWNGVHPDTDAVHAALRAECPLPDAQ